MLFFLGILVQGYCCGIERGRIACGEIILFRAIFGCYFFSVLALILWHKKRSHNKNFQSISNCGGCLCGGVKVCELWVIYTANWDCIAFIDSGFPTASGLLGSEIAICSLTPIY